MYRILSSLLVVGLLLGSFSLQAESKKKKKSSAKIIKRYEKGDYVYEKRSDGKTIKYEKKTKYEFEGADIEGLFKRPSGTYISNVKGVKSRSIIRIRKHFDPEVKDSSRLLR